MNGAHTEVLVTYLGIDEIKALENYGVDFSLADEKGRRSNALIKSLFNNQGPAVYEYLLTKESLLFSQDFDVVKEVFIVSSELNRPIQYAQKLIDSGAVVTEQTKEWIENDLRKSHPRYYSLVKTKLFYN